MKKLLLSLCTLFAAVVAIAQTTVTFDATIDKGEGKTLAKDGVTITISDGTLDNGKQYRFFKSHTVTIAAPDACNIIGVEFTCTAPNNSQYGPGCFSVDGNYTVNDKVGKWEGSAESVVFTAETNQVRATKVVVTILEKGQVAVSAPKADVEAGAYNEAQTVTLTAAEGCTIKYTLNGGEEQTYSEPIAIAETTTLVAWAVDEKGNKSGEVTYVYTIQQTISGTLAEAIASQDNDVITLTESMTVVYQYSDYLFVKAGDAYGLIYKKGGVGMTYNAGDVIAAGVTVKKTTYNGLIELTEPEGLTAGVAGTPVEPVATNIQECSAAAWVNKYVVITGATYDATTKMLQDANGTLAMYKRFDTALPTVNMKNVTVKGIMGVYNDTYQLQPITIEGEEVEVETPDTPDTPDTPVVVPEGSCLLVAKVDDVYYAMTTTVKDNKMVGQQVAVSEGKVVLPKEDESRLWSMNVETGYIATLAGTYLKYNGSGTNVSLSEEAYEWKYNQTSTLWMDNNSGRVILYRYKTNVYGAYSSQNVGKDDYVTPTMMSYVIDESVAVGAAKAAQSVVIYDLSGRRVEKAGKGLYIVNGKKVLY